MTPTWSFPTEGAEALGQRYEILRQLREEPWGGVWLAQDRLLGVEVGLKIVTRDASQFSLAREILLQEAALGIKLRHPHILAVFFANDVKEGVYLVQEPFPGESLLAALARQHRFSLPTALSLLEQIGRALAHAHEQGVVHQALAPLYILVADDQIRVANFACPMGNTDQAVFMELKAYTPPEVIQGEGNSAAGNIFSLGVLGFRMLAGSLPYPLTFDEPLPYRLEGPPLDLEEIPVPLQNLLLHCLTLEPEDRLPHGRAFLAALEQTRELWRAAPQEKWFPWQQEKSQPVRESARKAADLMGKLWEQGKPLPGRLVSQSKDLAGKIGESLKSRGARLKQAPPQLWRGLGLVFLVVVFVVAAMVAAPWLWRLATPPPPAPSPASPALKLPDMAGPPVAQVAEPTLPARARPAPGPTREVTPTLATPTQASPSQTREERFLVLVASYKEYSQAKALSQKLKSLNMNSGVVRTSPGGKTMYQVRVGPITGKKQAEEVARRVKSQAGLTPKIVQTAAQPPAARRTRR